ncbi:hypothetical protein DV515_00013249 [Chloebia gouldiae]|uniref:Uncharacterized protein n=1 Tax=Chloebia gouldiae TaxID=44316 RepID=A0A3L8S1I4_CHLGU|nr:hypothetical protein DV515_00013249 [Chloebia gouldiae]
MCRCQNPFHLSPPSPVTSPLSSAQDSRLQLVATPLCLRNPELGPWCHHVPPEPSNAIEAGRGCGMGPELC